MASLLIELRKHGFLPGEKRQRGRWRPGWRCQEGPGRGFLFILAKISQDLVDDVLVFDADDDSGRATAATANFNVDMEYSLDSLGPGDRDVSFSG